jgi:hypothetical protein
MDKPKYPKESDKANSDLKYEKNDTNYFANEFHTGCFNAGAI